MSDISATLYRTRPSPDESSAERRRFVEWANWSCYGIGDGHGGLAENVYANDALWACWQAARAIQGAKEPPDAR